MANEFYTPSNAPSTGASLSSATMRAEFQALATGMDKMPTMTANGDSVVVVNAGSTALSTVTRSALVDTTVVAATDKATPVDADLIPITDSAASNVLKKLTWANLKATLLTWLQGTVFPAPGAIGATTPSTGAFTTLSASDGTTASARIASSGGTISWNSRNHLDNAYSSAIYDATQHIFRVAGVEAGRFTTGRVLTLENGLAVTGTLSATGVSTFGTTATTGVNRLKLSGTTLNGPELTFETPDNGFKVGFSTSGSQRVYVQDGGGIDRVAISSTGLAVTGTLTTTGNTTLGDATTDTVQVNGYMGVGGAGSASVGLTVVNSALAGSTQQGVVTSITPTSTATTSINGIQSYAYAASGTFTTTNVRMFYAPNPAKGASHTITNLHGISVDDLTQGTNNYGITSQVSSGTNKWNVYASGTAANYFAGNVGIGFATPTTRLDVRGDSPVLLVRSTNASSVATLQLGGQDDSSNVALSSIVSGSEAPASTRSYLAFGTRPVAGGSPLERLRIDSVGNVGVGVTPSAWDATSYRAADIGYATLYGGSTNGAVGGVGSNYYIDAGGYKYKQSVQEAQALEWNNGAFTFKTAGTGTADTAITFTQSLAVGKGTTLALEGATSAAGTGIAFPATQLASSNANTLDDYEEGTFTPTIVGTTLAGAGTYSIQIGRYTKIGQQVTVTGIIVWSAHTGTGNMQLGALPFTSLNVTNFFQSSFCVVNNMTVTGQVAIELAPNSAAASINSVNNGAAAALAIDTAATIEFNLTYIAA